jgi:PAS domain S-box-containing protein
MFKKDFHKSIRYTFLKDISLILFAGTVVLSAVVGINEGRLLKHSLMTRGENFASYIAKLSQDPLIMKDSIQLDSLVNDANKDEDIIYTVIRDAQGQLITSQYASINYRSPRLKNMIAGLPKESDFSDVLTAINKNSALAEVSVPVRTGDDFIGTVTICMSEYNIRQQIVQTILFIITLNLLVAFVLGFALFAFSRKTILNPVIELGHAAARLAKGDLSTQVNIRTTGEIQMLVNSFNQMAADLQKTTVSQKTLQTILDSMPYAVIIINREKKILRVNNAALLLMGYETEDQLVGMSCHDTLCPAERDKCPIIDLNQNLDKAEKVLITRDGKRIPILKTVIPLNLDGKDVLLEAAMDITERKRAEDSLKKFADQLEQRNRELQDFAYIASHDLQEPLRKITSFGDRLKTRISGALDEQGHDYLARMQNAATRMQALINGLLMYSRVSTNELPFEPVDLAVVATEVLGDLEIRIEQVQGQVHINNLPTIQADPLQMRQLFQNLIGNALKFHAEGKAPVITITGQRIDGQQQDHGYSVLPVENWQITVQDNGIGLDEKYTDRIFGVFQRLHGRGEYEGSGIGLAICKKIVQRHGGSIVVKSSPGAGAAFIVTLPAIDASRKTQRS